MRGPLHEALRDATAEAHHSLENDLDWASRIGTRDGYRRLLAGFRGFHAAYESAIGAALADEEFFGPRRRLERLDADLMDLGLSSAVVAALPSPTIAPFPTLAAGMGALYVLEGSTLGGQVICREVEQRLGLGEAGTRYYRGHGRDTGRMWKSFLARLETLSGDATAEREALASGIETFQALADWMSDDPQMAAA